MPTTKRRRRHARGTGGRGLSDAQREILLFGYPVLDLDGRDFASDAAEKAAWFRFRGELMKEHSGPGKRPVGYFVHELGCQDADRFSWFDAIAELLRRDLLNEGEKLQIEAKHKTLSASQHVEFCEPFATAEGIRRSQITGFVLQEFGREFDFASTWHQQRGRSEFSEKFMRLAASIWAFMQDHAG